MSEKRMRLAWFTPMARPSAIGRYSMAAVGALSAYADVDVFYPRTGDDIPCPGACENVAIDAIGDARTRLAGYDTVFYNFGNYLGYHNAIYETYLQVPGVPILHDKVMQGFFVSRITRQFAPDYLCLMQYLYGREGRQAVLPLYSHGWTTALEALTARHFPGFEPCLVNAPGCVVHSRSAADLVSARYGHLLPVEVLDLPTFIYDFEYPGQPLLTREELGAPGDLSLVVVAGRMNPTKRIEATITAIAGDAFLKQKALLAIVGGGEPEYVSIIEQAAARAGLGEHLRLVTHPDDRLLHSYIAAADVCVNLRNPSTESASASLVEQMYFGKPIVVTKTGVYDEVPDDVVVKTTTDDEVGSIRAALHRLLADEAYRESIGTAASAYVRAHHTPEVYAKRLLRFASELPQRSRHLMMVDEAAEELTSIPIDAAFDERVDELAHRVALQLLREPDGPATRDDRSPLV